MCATIGLWGPRARDVLGGGTDGPVDDAALPTPRRAVRSGSAPAPVLASRISYAGELGWELTWRATGPSRSGTRCVDAGRGHGLEPFGYRALDALRLEKGYRYYGTDLTMLETPDEAGLGAFVRPAKGPFIGREALLVARRDGAAGRPDRRLRTVDRRRRRLPAGLRRRGRPGRRRGRRATAQRRLRHTVGADDRHGLPAGGVGRGRRASRSTCSTSGCPAIVAADVLVDPDGERMRA